MTTKTEGTHPGEFILTEANGARSRDNVIYASGEVVKAGQVLAHVPTAGDTIDTIDDVDSPGEYVAWETGLVAVAVAYADYDATDADVEGVAVTRDAEVKGDSLVWPDNTTDDEKAEEAANLKRRGILVR